MKTSRKQEEDNMAWRGKADGGNTGRQALNAVTKGASTKLWLRENVFRDIFYEPPWNLSGVFLMPGWAHFLYKSLSVWDVNPHQGEGEPGSSSRRQAGLCYLTPKRRICRVQPWWDISTTNSKSKYTTEKDSRHTSAHTRAENSPPSHLYHILIRMPCHPKTLLQHGLVSVLMRHPTSSSLEPEACVVWWTRCCCCPEKSRPPASLSTAACRTAASERTLQEEAYRLNSLH